MKKTAEVLVHRKCQDQNGRIGMLAILSEIESLPLVREIFPLLPLPCLSFFLWVSVCRCQVIIIIFPTLRPFTF